MKKALFVLIAIIIAFGLGVLGVILVQHNYIALPTPPSTRPTTGANTSTPAHSEATFPSTGVPQATQETQVTTPTQITQPQNAVKPNGELAGIALPVLTKTETAADGTVVFTYTSQNVVLSLPDMNISKTVSADLLQRIETSSARVRSLQAAAHSDYVGQTSWRSYYYTILYGAKRIDQRVLSLYGREEFYGSSQSQSGSLTVTYDLATGNVLSLQNVVLDDTGVYKSLMEALLESLAKNAQKFQLYDEYKEIICDDFSNYLTAQNRWYFSDEGLCFVFSPYYIAPNSAGTVIATVPYDQLHGILQDHYFPVSQPEASSTILLSSLETVDLDRFSHFCVLENAVSGNTVVFSTDGILSNVQVEQGHIMGTSRYVPDAVIFLANRLSPEDAILLQDSFDGSHVLKLRYNVGDTAYSFFLIKDADGNVTLASSL